MASAALALVAGAAASAESLHEVQQPVVYGSDDRMDVAQHPDAALRSLADASIVTLIQRPAIDVSTGGFRIGGATLGASQDLCSDERFVDQPAAGFCSGTLIGQDLVLTAGHCIDSERACQSTVLAFNYQWSNGLEALGQNDIYNCREIVVRAESESPTRDYAVLRLDRPVVNHGPQPMRDARGSLQAGQGFTIIGSPSGLPQKIDDGGSVRDPGAGSTVFVGTPDSFGGNSGSGIFADGTLDLIGILISGEQDYETDGSCNRVKVCGENGCQGETMLHAGVALDALCGARPGAEPCGASVCGDGVCTLDEQGVCSDCDVAPVCGNGWCEGDEWTGCEQDCVVQVPAGWTCDPTYYGTLDGCDCNCGVYDPDCDAGQEVLNCGFGAVCNLDGTCASGGDSAFCDVSTTAAGSRMRLFALLCALAGAVFMRRRVRA